VSGPAVVGHVGASSADALVALPEEINVALEKFGRMMPREGDRPECERAR